MREISQTGILIWNEIFHFEKDNKILLNYRFKDEVKIIELLNFFNDVLSHSYKGNKNLYFEYLSGIPTDETVAFYKEFFEKSTQFRTIYKQEIISLQLHVLI